MLTNRPTETGASTSDAIDTIDVMNLRDTINKGIREWIAPTSAIKAVARINQQVEFNEPIDSEDLSNALNDERMKIHFLEITLGSEEYLFEEALKLIWDRHEMWYVDWWVTSSSCRFVDNGKTNTDFICSLDGVIMKELLKTGNLWSEISQRIEALWDLKCKLHFTEYNTSKKEVVSKLSIISTEDDDLSIYSIDVSPELSDSLLDKHSEILNDPEVSNIYWKTMYGRTISLDKITKTLSIDCWDSPSNTFVSELIPFIESGTIGGLSYHYWEE